MPSEAMQALYAGEAERAEALLAPDGELSVFEAAAFGRSERLRAVLADDPAAAAAFSDDGFTALHVAIFGGREASVRILLEHGADPNVRSRSDIARVPPLGTAAFVRSKELARVLLDAGADVDGQGAGGFTALHTAAVNGDIELARLLLERGADPEVANGDGNLPGDLARDEALGALLRARQPEKDA